MWFWVTQQNRQRQFELYVLSQRDLKNDLEQKEHENKWKHGVGGAKNEIIANQNRINKYIYRIFFSLHNEKKASQTSLMAVLTKNTQRGSCCNLTLSLHLPPRPLRGAVARYNV